MKYKLDEITIRIIDIAENARLYGEEGDIPEHDDYRLEIIADNGTRRIKTISPRDMALTADEILRLMNR